MIRRLHEPHAGKVTRRRTFHNRLHQAPPDSAVLDRRVDGYRPDAGDRIAFVEKIAADDAAVQFGNDLVKARTRKKKGENHDGAFGIGKVGRKVMLLRDRLERFVNYCAARPRVFRPAFPQLDFHRRSPELGWRGD
jgi:hypothetical protein